MPFITYREFGDSKTRTFYVEVRLAGKVAGKIEPTLNGGYRYYPKGADIGGDTFGTVEEVKKSLEEEG